jgi:predicted transcriptional regulator
VKNLVQGHIRLLSGDEIIFAVSPLGDMPQMSVASLESNNEAANEMVEMLVSIGACRENALIIVALNESGGFQSSRDLQKMCNLRQPEVSVAMKTLLESEMVACEPLKGGGRGRPCHRYSLNGDLKSIIHPYIADAEVRLAKLGNDIARLDEVSRALTSQVSN